MRLRKIALLTCLAVAALAAVPPQQALARDRQPGIDASEYQGNVDWQRVADSGITFVIHRATKGNDYIDPTYPGNKAEAEAAGIRFTAYHYAKPSGREDDARREAELFLANADLGTGNLIPALDLEQAGGMNPTKLKAWVGIWLRRVTDELGVKPIIYTSPSFWRSFMNDTRRFARHGHKLWIANWFVRHPDVPAKDWAGHGWTFWQYSNSGHVPGINGRVDLDRYNGRTFAKVRIP